jgi:dTDP-4-amino-4,6-dideoxygalactose transaminase
MHTLKKISLFQNQRLWEQIKKPVFDLVDKEHESGMAQNSNLVQRLEHRLAERFNRKYCITFANCTDALVAACIALQLPDKSMVAVSNYTFTASAHAIARAGYSVVPVDVLDNCTINPDEIHNVRAVVAVDLYGNMSDWTKLQKLNLPLINDAAQSLESHNGECYSAKLGDVSCISFSPSKTISSWGSGGALLTDNGDIAELAKKLRLHGKTKNSDLSVHAGMNSMISSFEAACIWVGLDHSDQWQKRRSEIANYLIGESVYPSLLDTGLYKNTFHKLVFLSNNRDQIQITIREYGIDCVVHYNLTINDEILYYTNNKFPNSDKFKKTVFTVPNQHTLYDDEVEQIAKVLK